MNPKVDISLVLWMPTNFEHPFWKSHLSIVGARNQLSQGPLKPECVKSALGPIRLD